MAIQYSNSLDRAFHALGDGTRRQMVSMLVNEGELSATELGDPFGVAQPTISKHIKVLEQAGLVQREVEGRVHRFRINDGVMKEAEDWIAEHRVFWTGTLARLERFVTDHEGS